MAKWIQGAIKHPGAFTAKAKAAGEGTQAFASEVISKSKKKKPGEKGSTLLRQALLAKTLNRMHK
jgi:hypothetical protein